MLLSKSKGLLWKPGDFVRLPFGAIHHSHLIGAATPLPDSVDLARGWSFQGNESSCTGHAWSKQIPGADPHGIYALRAMDYPGTGPLPDVGAYPATIADGLVRFGVVRLGAGPIDVAQRLSLDELITAQGFRVTAFAKVAEDGEALADAIMAALARGIAPVFSMEVDEAYENLGPNDVYDRMSGRSQGAHMQAIDAYSEGGKLFGVAGSWGPGWAQNGRAWLTRNAIVNLAHEVYIAETVPVL